MVGVKGRSGGGGRKTTAQLKAEGGYRADRHANRADAVSMESGKSETLRKPRGLSAGGKRLWDKLVAGLPAGVVTSSDEESINELVKVWEMMQKARKICEADLADDKAMSQYTKLFDRWYKLINEYGGTPNSRAKLQVPRSKEDREQTDAFGAILDRATGGRN